MKFSDNHRMYILEGNIGSGKSTLLKAVGEYLDIDIVPEPAVKWQQDGRTGNILDLFYKDTSRWAYTFQSYAFITRIQAIIEHQKAYPDKEAQLLERSVYCDRFCFAKHCYEAGFMTALEWKVYREWFAWLVEQYEAIPKGFIYLRVSPEVALARMGKRCRSEERGITLDYLQALHHKHEEWLIEKNDVDDLVKNVPVLVLDGDAEFEQNFEGLEKHLRAIAQFIEVPYHQPYAVRHKIQQFLP